jgi:hypothetical protein
MSLVKDTTNQINNTKNIELWCNERNNCKTVTKMAKNRKGGASKVGSRAAPTMKANDGSKATPPRTAKEPDALWVMAQVIEGSNQHHVCHINGCDAEVVAVWKKANQAVDDDQTWPVCSTHQEQQPGAEPAVPSMPEAVPEGTDVCDEFKTESDDFDVPRGDDAQNAQENVETDCIARNDEESEQNSDEDDDEEPDALWDLKKIMSIDDIMHECPIKCSHKTCKLPAAAVWVCNAKPNENWYSCLDCQVRIPGSIGSSLCHHHSQCRFECGRPK